MFSDPKVRKAYIWTIFAGWVAFVIFSCVISTQKMISQNRAYDERAERDATRPVIQEHNHALDEVIDSLEKVSESSDDRSHKASVPADETTSQPQTRKVTPHRESPVPLIAYITLCVILTIPLVYLAVHDKLLRLFVCETIFILIQLFILNTMVLSTYTYMVH